MPSSVNCLCNLPEIIEHSFISCKYTFLFYDILQRTHKKNIYITPYEIRFLFVHPGVVVPYYLIILVRLHRFCRSRIIDQNGDLPRTTKSLFIEIITDVGNHDKHDDHEGNDEQDDYDRCENYDGHEDHDKETATTTTTSTTTRWLRRLLPRRTGYFVHASECTIRFEASALWRVNFDAVLHGD